MFTCANGLLRIEERYQQRFSFVTQLSELSRAVTMVDGLPHAASPDYLYFWYHLNARSSATTLGILMRIPHNQDMICIFVVFEAQLLAIPVAKDIDCSIFYFFHKILKNLRKIDVHDAKSSISRKRDLAFVEYFAKGI